MIHFIGRLLDEIVRIFVGLIQARAIAYAISSPCEDF
jgi:hypothetical protein